VRAGRQRRRQSQRLLTMVAAPRASGTDGPVSGGGSVRWAISAAPPWNLMDASARCRVAGRTRFPRPGRALRTLAALLRFSGDDVRRVQVLSGGEKARWYGRSCSTTRQCLVLDEPTNHLDMAPRRCWSRRFAIRGPIVYDPRQALQGRAVNRVLDDAEGFINTAAGLTETWRVQDTRRLGCGAEGATRSEVLVGSARGR